MAKILVFTSYGGGGHISASQALSEYLGKTHKVTVVPFFVDVLDKMDPVKFFTFRKYHVEDMYNFFLRKKSSRASNFIYNLSRYGMPVLEPMILTLLDSYIKKNKPDMIISVIPLVNNSILKIAERYNIPFLLIPTDLDSTTFVFGINKPTYKKFFISLAYPDSSILEKIKKIDINSKQIVVTGFPIRTSFFEPKNKQMIKKAFDIPEKIPVLLLMMGAEGSSALLNYLHELLKIQVRFHIIILLGRNELLRSQIEQIKWPSHITYSIIGFTNQIADLMAISDLCVTKSGSVSVSECLYMKLPAILDGTGIPLLWEAFNLNFIKQNKLGNYIKNYKEIVPKVTRYLSNRDAYEEMQEHLNRFSPPIFKDNIEEIVADILK